MLGCILDFYGVVLDPKTQLPMAGIHEFLAELDKRAILCAIASSSDSTMIHDFLIDSGLAEFIHVIVGCDKVSAIKPNPECYVQAATLLQLKPEDCLVIDDTAEPLANAKQLGFNTVLFGDKIHTFAELLPD
ncbi:MAG: HAD-IA family hydrolase [Patescibacteria group bacterium]|jgi:HAD superfamily hydrolase (TIGR01509 family)